MLRLARRLARRLAGSTASIRASAGLACAGLLATIALVSTAARAAATLEGTWSAGPLSELVTVTSWVDECGPKPKSGGGSSGSYVVTASGDELVFSGTPPFRTDLCWERGPVRRVSHSTNPVARTWKTRCESSPGDVRKATITTQVSASSDDVIVLSEKAHYEVTVASGTCAADVERSRAWRIVTRAGAPVATVTTTSATATEVVPSATATVKTPEIKRCETIGDAAAVDVRPHKRSIRAGESATFTAHVVDAKGCDVGTKATFRVATDGAGASAVTVDPSGKITASASAPPATYAIVAEGGGHAAKVDLEIVSEEKYLQLLDAGATTELAAASSIDGEATPSSPPSIVTPTSADDGSTRRLGVAALGSGVVLLLAVAGVAVMRKSKPKPARPPAKVPISSRAPPPVVAVAPRVASERPPEPARPISDRPAAVDPVQRLGPRPRVVGRGDFAKQTMVGGSEILGDPAPAKPSFAKVCPACGLGYPAHAEFCSEDGARLVPATATPAKRCATCGRTFEASAVFCPNDGSGLVPM